MTPEEGDLLFPMGRCRSRQDPRRDDGQVSEAADRRVPANGPEPVHGLRGRPALLLPHRRQGLASSPTPSSRTARFAPGRWS
jgi:hypothetical protein